MKEFRFCPDCMEEEQHELQDQDCVCQKCVDCLEPIGLHGERGETVVFPGRSEDEDGPELDGLFCAECKEARLSEGYEDPDEAARDAWYMSR